MKWLGWAEYSKKVKYQFEMDNGHKWGWRDNQKLESEGLIGQGKELEYESTWDVVIKEF